MHNVQKIFQCDVHVIFFEHLYPISKALLDIKLDINSVVEWSKNSSSARSALLVSSWMISVI